ncbi:MAG: hypothetical protein BAA03_11670 [Caldibacillus debilis]|nr:MAG: hypothetical protein BAA03_11670 [Caldibacillus debilis]
MAWEAAAGEHGIRGRFLRKPAAFFGRKRPVNPLEGPDFSSRGHVHHCSGTEAAKTAPVFQKNERQPYKSFLCRSQW